MHIKKPFTKEQFIERSRKKHGNKYDYSKADYEKSTIKVCIICPEHGEFWQTPTTHMKGVGCPKCGIERAAKKQTRTQDEFLEKMKAIHGGIYDYSKTVYINCKKKVTVTCKEHGDFEITPDDLARGHGCPVCRYIKMKNKLKLAQEEFIERIKKFSTGNIDFSKVEYVNAHTKVCLVCTKKDENGNMHGEFWREPNHVFLNGCCCPKCNESSLESFMRKELKMSGVVFEEQKKFEWLRDKGHMSLDFYLPEYNIAIECQGLQHFIHSEVFNGDFEGVRRRDCLKNKLCEEHGIKIIYITLNKYKKFASINPYNEKNIVYFTTAQKIDFKKIQQIIN